MFTKMNSNFDFIDAIGLYILNIFIKYLGDSKVNNINTVPDIIMG